MTNSRNFKTHFWTFIMWAANVKIFLAISNWEQIAQIFKYSDGLISFYVSLYKYYLIFVTTIPHLTMFLWVVFVILLYIFWFYYFAVYFHRLPNKQIENTGFWGLIGSVLTFLGFGCVACGQTLLTSIILFFASTTTTFAAHLVGNLSIVLGIVILSYGIYKNYKMYHNKNICLI